MSINWESSILWGMIGLIATIFFGYIFYIKSIKNKSLSIFTTSDTLVSESLTKYKGLKIFYNKKHIKELVSTTITIKNIGNLTIEVSDISSSSPITFCASKEFLLNDVKDYILYSSNKNSVFRWILHLYHHMPCLPTIIIFIIINYNKALFFKGFHDFNYVSLPPTVDFSYFS